MQDVLQQYLLLGQASAAHILAGQHPALRGDDREAVVLQRSEVVLRDGVFQHPGVHGRADQLGAPGRKHHGGEHIIGNAVCSLPKKVGGSRGDKECVRLFGKGDMLYFPSNLPKPLRVQGAFVSDEEVENVVSFLKENAEEVSYDESIAQATVSQESMPGSSKGDDERDSLFAEAGRFVIENEKGSIGSLQRHFKIGFNRAGRIMDQLADAKVVGPELGTKPRKVEMTMEEFETLLKQQ